MTDIAAGVDRVHGGQLNTALDPSAASRDMHRAEAEASRAELADFLRAQREQLQPEVVGIPRHPRRRVPGLRRHEVADLAMVSDTWYTWLEQGRDIRVSSHLLDAVCRALRLDDDAWRYARRLAGIPVLELQPPPDQATPGLSGLVDDLLPSPACLTTAPFDFVAWNAAYARLFGDPDRFVPSQRNALWLLVHGVPGLVDRDTHMREAAARLRAEAAKHPGNARFAEVVAELRQRSGAFAEAWESRHVRRFQPAPQEVVHDKVGRIKLQLLQLRPLDQPALVLMVHRGADANSRERLAELLDTSDQHSRPTG
jgi:transcriptional regulator with XRE-family HTH domain